MSFPRLSHSEFVKRRAYGENNINIGRLRELPSICVDRFFGESLQATIFLLSHCHTDHMVGLDEEGFWDRLKQPGIKLYTHRLTPVLISLFNSYLLGEQGIQSLLEQGKIVPLDTHTPVNIFDDVTGTTVKLTFLPAGHCPGSVMFQFEYDDQCILYTGDCRITVNDLTAMDSLHLTSVTNESSGISARRVKDITHVYIDTTFCSSRSQDFPEREDAIDQLIKLIRQWFCKSHNNSVNLLFAAKFSHEYVLLRCYKSFGIKFHVSQQRYAAYQQLPELRSAVTINENTKFHLCDKDAACLNNCTSGSRRTNFLRIKLSSLWYMKNKYGFGPDKAVKHTRNNDQELITLCYAMHSSLDEIASMIKYLKPNVVTPLVLPKGMQRKQLESELRRGSWEPFVFEDYVKGLENKTVIRVLDSRMRPSKSAEPVQTSAVASAQPVGIKRKRMIRWTPPPSPLI